MKETQAHTITLKGSDKKELEAVIHFPKKGYNFPLLIFCHGFKGFKNWGPWENVGTYFATKGFAFVRFDFSHNGFDPKYPNDLTNKELFGKNTLSNELEDIKLLIAELTDKSFEFVDKVNIEDISIIGHSRGGSTALLATILNEKIKKVVTWSAVADIERYVQLPPNALAEWESRGVRYFKNSRTQEDWPMNYSFYQDYQKNKEQYNLQTNLAKLDKPLLILHGTEDKVVDFSEAQAMNQHVLHSIMVAVEGADHTYGAKFGDDKISPNLHFVLEETSEFLQM